MFYKGRVVKDTGGQFRSNFQRVNISWLPNKTRAYYIQYTQPDLYFGKEFHKAEYSNATHAKNDDQIHAHKYFL